MKWCNIRFINYHIARLLLLLPSLVSVNWWLTSMSLSNVVCMFSHTTSNLLLLFFKINNGLKSACPFSKDFISTVILKLIKYSTKKIRNLEFANDIIWCLMGKLFFMFNFFFLTLSIPRIRPSPSKINKFNFKFFQIYFYFYPIPAPTTPPPCVTPTQAIPSIFL